MKDRLGHILRYLPDKSMEESIRNPHGGIDRSERRVDEPWHERWHRLIGSDPGMREKKSTTNSREPMNRNKGKMYDGIT